jgi:xanthine dehydrogenase molybdenum-binding subunit
MNMMPQGFIDQFSKNINYFDSFNQCMQKGKEYIRWEEKRKLYENQTGPSRGGGHVAALV